MKEKAYRGNRLDALVKPEHHTFREKRLCSSPTYRQALAEALTTMPRSATKTDGTVARSPVDNSVERVSKRGHNPVPAAVAHFVNTLSTASPHHRTPANRNKVEHLESSPRNPHALLLRRFLSLLNSVEGRAWISTLPLPEQTAYTGVRSSLERVLAVGHLAAIAYPTTTQEPQ